jgi:hypothetical protein
LKRGFFGEKNMSDEKSSGDNFNVRIGDVSGGQVAVGKHISQTLTKAESIQFERMFEDLRSEIEEKAPPEEKEEALEKVAELKEAVTEKEPNLTKMEAVRNWFVKHLPTVAGSVTGLIINPLVGKLVQAGGDALVGTFRRRFGIQ